MNVNNLISFVEKNYKRFILAYLIIVAIMFSYIFFKYFTEGYILKLSVELKGGYSIQIYSPSNIYDKLENIIRNYTNDYSIVQSESYYVINIPGGVNITEIVREIENIGIPKENIAYFSYSSTVSQTIFQQFLQLIIVSIVLVALIIFISFRKNLVYLPIILTIFTDLLSIIFVLSLFNIPISTMSFLAMAMVLGFAIDNNVVLSTNILKEKEIQFVERVRRSFRVGFLMEITLLTLMLGILIFVKYLTLIEFAIALIVAILVDLYMYLFVNVPIFKYITERMKS